jgi:2-dehydropantoate 2-reductase
MGTGALGGYFGGRLAEAGEDVTFIARGAQLAALRETGLTIESPRGNLRIARVRATDDVASIGSVDVVLFTVKLWSTEQAARALPPLMARDTAVLSLQNGVESNEVLSRSVGREHVMGAVCYIAAVLDRPGIVQHTGQMARVVFGELDGRKSARAEAFLAACVRAGGGFDAELSPDVERAIWEKFVFIVGLSGLTTLARRPIGPVRSDPDTRALLLDVLREAVAVGRAKDVNLDPDFAEKRLEFIDTLPPDMTSSMLRDLERGNRLEVKWLSGAVARLGRDLRIDTPANRAVYAALKLLADGAASTR